METRWPEWPLLTQNSELAPLGIFNWTLPAWVVRDGSGRGFNVCPEADACAKVCYARNGTYLFPQARAAHARNLELVRHNTGWWMVAMLHELGARRLRPRGSPRLALLSREHLSAEVAGLLDCGAQAVRIHDSGDFFDADYLRAWLTIARQTPDVLFYAYTKAVAMLKAVGPEAPPNFLWCYSLGGKQDHLVDRERDRHADVFPDAAAIEAAGYYDQTRHDLLCVVGPSNRVGIPANNIPAFNRRIAGRTFGEMETERAHHRTAEG